jgi:hypothetical protein
MAIIRTQLVSGQRRIITKVVNGQRRVSCSCCETECCMYPAYEYDAISDSGLIKHEDLPNVMFGGGAQYNKIQPVEIFETRYGVYLDPASPNEENEGYIYWDSEGGDFGPTWSAFAEGGRNCLVEDLELFWRDDFADTYTVERRTETLTGPPDATFTITRESLCRWCGFDPLLESTICLEYNAPTFAGQGHWSIEGFGEAPPRNNSSPVGNYNDGGSIWMVLEP